MVTLIPSKSVQKKFPAIDFTSLSLAYSVIVDGGIPKKRVPKFYVISVKLTKRPYSFYNFQKGTKVSMRISENINTERMFLRHVSHEFRHFMQDKTFHIPYNRSNYDDSTSEKYYNSPIEIDADGFDILVHNKLMRVYKRVQKIRKGLCNVVAYNPTGELLNSSS